VAGPSKVEFPGKQKQRIRMRGTKKASGSVKEKLDKNLTMLLEEPHSVLPTITGPTSRGLFRPDKLKACLKEVEKIIDKREDPKWLRKKMTKGGTIARAFAGSLVAAHEEDVDTVAIFKHPVYGSVSFIRRGNGRPAHLLGFQMHSHPEYRLLAWEEMAREGYWFFSWGKEFVCTGVEPDPPKEWLISCLNNGPLKFINEDDIWKIGDDSNFVKLVFPNGIEVIISLDSLTNKKASFVKSVALTMSPPRLSDIIEVELNYLPQGWPDDKIVNDEAKKGMDAVIEHWLRLEIGDSDLQRGIHQSFCAQLDEGLMLDNIWFDIDDRNGFLSELQGSDIELEAVEVILDTLEGGVRVDAAENAHWLANDVVHLEGNSAHALLKATWGKCGMDILEKLFSLTGDDAEVPYEQQLKGKKAFGGFLRELDSKQSNVRMMRKFPWDSSSLPSPLDFADSLIKTAHAQGVGKTTTMARKSGDSSKASMGWAWVSVHGKNESESWHYEQTVRDKGGDWVPNLKALWDASKLVIEEGEVESYLEAMEKLRNSTGVIDALPEL